MSSKIQCMIDQWTLPNGVRIVGERMPWLRTASIGVWLHVGSMMELPEENGLSHFMEHMMFKGTERRSYRQISEEMDAVGGQLDAFTTKDCTCAYAKVIDENVPLALDILSDMIIHAAIADDQLEKERGVILEEIAMDEDSPDDVANELLARALYGEQPFAMPILGPAEQVAAYTRDDLLRFREKHYRPEGTVIAIVGSYDPDEVPQLCAKYFGAWENGGVPSVIPPMTARGGVTLARDKDTEQLQLCLGYPGLYAGSEDLFPMSVLNSILGGSMSSRLFQRVREELGMAYAIYSYPQTYSTCGLFGIAAGVSPKNAATVIREIRAVNEALVKDGISEKEFTAAKTQLRSGYLMGLESPGAMMQSFGRRLLLLNDVRTPEQVLQQIEAVTPGRVMETAARILSAEPCVALAGQQAEALAKELA